MPDEIVDLFTIGSIGSSSWVADFLYFTHEVTLPPFDAVHDVQGPAR